MPGHITAVRFEPVLDEDALAELRRRLAEGVEGPDASR